MAAAFRSITNTTYASRANTTVNKPSGTVDGDALIAAIFTGGSGSAPSASAPDGTWSAIGTPTVVNKDGFYGRLSFFRKKAGSSEPSSYTFTHSTASSQAALIACSGTFDTNFLDVSSSNTGFDGTSTATSVTTTAANDLLIYGAHDWEGSGALSPPSGFTERLDSLVYVGTAVQASAGASGNKTQTNANPSGSPWAAWLIAIKETEGGSQTLVGSLFTNTNAYYGGVVQPGAVTLTGTLFTDTDTFYGGTVSQSGGPQTLVGSLYTNSQSFYAGTVAPGSVTLTGSLFSNSNTFFGGAVKASNTLVGTLFTDGDTFYGGTVAASYVVTGSLYTDPDTFFGGEIIQPNAPQTLVGELYANDNQFFGGEVVGGSHRARGDDAAPRRRKPAYVPEIPDEPEPLPKPKTVKRKVTKVKVKQALEAFEMPKEWAVTPAVVMKWMPPVFEVSADDDDEALIEAIKARIQRELEEDEEDILLLLSAA